MYVAYLDRIDAILEDTEDLPGAGIQDHPLAAGHADHDHLTVS